MNNIKFAPIGTKARDAVTTKTVLLYMDAFAFESREVIGHDFKHGSRLFSIPCKVLRSEGPQGSFAPIDNQAKRVGMEIMTIIDKITKEEGEVTDIMVLCDHAEIRSPAVAMGLAFGYGVKASGLNNERPSTASTFAGRTASWIHDIVDDYRTKGLEGITSHA